MSSNSILALDKLPFDVVRMLMASANALEARHVKPVRRGFFRFLGVRQHPGLMGCEDTGGMMPGSPAASPCPSIAPTLNCASSSAEVRGEL